MLALTNCAWGALRPLQFVPHTSQQNIDLSVAALRFKMDELQAAKSAPDIMLIGSSLPMCAFFYTEGPGYFDLTEGDKIRSLSLNLLQAYPEAGYFTAQLKKLTGKHIDVFNFAGAACMVSDTKLVLERAVAAGRKPPLIIYGVGLRDFVDNVNPPPGETPYFKALCNAPFVMRHLPYLFPMHAFPDLSIGAFCKMYALRNEFRTAAEHVVCKFLHHPTSIELAFMFADLNQKAATASGALPAQAIVPSTSTIAKTNRDAKTRPLPQVQVATSAQKTETTANVQAPASPGALAVLDYPQRYSPANYRRLDAEMIELKNLIAYCKSQNIKLILVNMPVSQGHRKVSPPGLREAYLDKLRAIAPSASLFIDYENELLPDSQFFDTVHLAPEGAVNFVNNLSARLKDAGFLSSTQKQTKLR